jgi:hypothetical protein
MCFLCINIKNKFLKILKKYYFKMKNNLNIYYYRIPPCNLKIYKNYGTSLLFYHKNQGTSLNLCLKILLLYHKILEKLQIKHWKEVGDHWKNTA